MDNRIGTYNDDGSVKAWPDKTLTGQDYNRYWQAPSRTRLDAQHFVVMDASPLPAETRDVLLAKLAAKVAPPEPVKSEPTPKGRVNEPARTGE